MSNSTWLHSMILLLGVIGSTWLTLAVTKEITAVHINQPTNADTFIKNAEYIELDSLGHTHIKIRAEKIIHYTKNDISILTTPHLELTFNDQLTWKISSTNGKTEGGSNKIFLWGNVQIEKKPSKNQKLPAFTLKTNSITIYPQRKFAETKDPLLFKQGKNSIQAIGAKANLVEGNIELLSNIVAKYVIE